MRHCTTSLLCVCLFVVACRPVHREYAQEESTAKSITVLPVVASTEVLPPICPPACPVCPATECPDVACPPPHVAGTIACAEIDSLLPTVCEGIARACSESHCPIAYPHPVARVIGQPKPTHCLEGHATACHESGKDNHVFVDCCADAGTIEPQCSTHDDCPVPLGECVRPWCGVDGFCKVTTKPTASDCGVDGHCNGGFCYPSEE